MLFKLDHEGCALVPVSGDFGRKITPVKNGLNYSGRKGSTVQRPLVLGHGDELVDKRLLLDDVVCLLVIVGVLQLVGLLAEQRLPQGGLDHEQNIEKLGLATSGSIPNKNEVEHPSPDLPSKLVELLLQLGNR